MGPEYGSEKYKEQVESIVLALGDQGLTEDALDSLILLFVMDTSYSRTAIYEARKKILNGQT